MIYLLGFFEKGGNYYLPLNSEYNGFRIIDDISYNKKKKKMEKKLPSESSTIILIFNYK